MAFAARQRAPRRPSRPGRCADPGRGAGHRARPADGPVSGLGQCGYSLDVHDRRPDMEIRLRQPRVLTVLALVVTLGVALLGNIAVSNIEPKSLNQKLFAWLALAILFLLSIGLELVRRRETEQQPADQTPSPARIRQAADRVEYLTGLTAHPRQSASEREVESMRHELARTRAELDALRRHLATAQPETGRRSRRDDERGRVQSRARTPEAGVGWASADYQRRLRMRRWLGASAGIALMGMAAGLIYILFERSAPHGAQATTLNWTTLTPVAIFGTLFLMLNVFLALPLAANEPIGFDFILANLFMTLLFTCGIAADFAIKSSISTINVAAVAQQLAATAVVPFINWFVVAILDRLRRRRAR
ncbi:hypothetical protein [Dactylosporangium sp. NPDC051541]|uniref:hypothetical protein n=1 Tax=Dactylosporangium sp. NPDC051541 TaxID=3363977 RepID=UPI00378F4D40